MKNEFMYTLTRDGRNTKMEKVYHPLSRDKFTSVYGDMFPAYKAHTYVVFDRFGNNLLEVHFQHGTIRAGTGKLPNGIFMEDLLLMCSDRLQHFQSGEYACDENQKALEHIDAALMFLNKRTLDREKRGVLGSNKK